MGRAAFKAVGTLDTRPVGSTPTSSATDTEYGSHAFTVADYEGNHRHFGTYDPLAESTGEN